MQKGKIYLLKKDFEINFPLPYIFLFYPQKAINRGDIREKCGGRIQQGFSPSPTGDVRS